MKADRVCKWRRRICFCVPMAMSSSMEAPGRRGGKGLPRCNRKGTILGGERLASLMPWMCRRRFHTQSRPTSKAHDGWHSTKALGCAQAEGGEEGEKGGGL